MTNEASDHLSKNLTRIMDLWEERACREVEAAIHQESLALRNSIPEYLTQLVNALSMRIDRTTARVKWDRKESSRVGEKHGQERAKALHYTMDQLIFEYHILREVIFDVLEEEVELTPNQREVILCSIEQAVNDAATQFSSTLADAQEKLTHTLAHDLRGPLTAARLSAQLILRRLNDVSYCEKAASRISDNMDRLDAMIHDLLDASRLRAGHGLPLEFDACDLDLIVNEVAEEFRFTLGRDRIVTASSGTCPGWWSESGIQRLIENLVTNAVKYGDADAPITIRLDQADESVTLSVHNEGNPISKEEQATLFQHHQRTRSAENQPGWGLGLTVVQGMAEAHHGTVRLESQEGRGTTFIITLPRDCRGTGHPGT